MSNFICPTCGMNNIDCGKQGYKTDKEIELEEAIKAYKQILACIDCERLPARMQKAYYEHSMESINWVFENMLDEQFNLKDDLDY